MHILWYQYGITGSTNWMNSLVNKNLLGIMIHPKELKKDLAMTWIQSTEKSGLEKPCIHGHLWHIYISNATVRDFSSTRIPWWFVKPADLDLFDPEAQTSEDAAGWMPQSDGLWLGPGTPILHWSLVIIFQKNIGKLQIFLKRPN